MNIVLGASGRVGGAIVDCLDKEKVPVKAVVHSAEKAEKLKPKGTEVAVADSFDRAALQEAFQGGSTVFVLTPETGKSNDVIGDTRTILANYRAAVKASSVRKVVGLSSMGAQYAVGNLEMSYLLERAFDGLGVQTVFVRPAYYYSNWLGFISVAKEQGVLPTFYPIALKIPMIAPQDVAAFVADLLVKPTEEAALYEVEGPEWYSSQDVAEALEDVLGRRVEARQMPREQWDDQLKKIGYTDNAIENFKAMTELVIAGKSGPEGHGTISVKTRTTLAQYLTSGVLDSFSGK